MRAAPGLLVLGVAGALLAVALFFGRGSSDGRLFWIGIGASLAALVLVFATLLGFLPRPSPTKRGWWALGLFTAFVLWSGLTIAWSIAPDRSWAYLNRGPRVPRASSSSGCSSPRSCDAAGDVDGGAAGGALPRRARLGAAGEGRSRACSRTARASRGCATRSATGTPSRSSPRSRFRSASGWPRGGGMRGSCAPPASSSSTSPASPSCSRTRGRASSSPRRASASGSGSAATASRGWRCSSPGAGPGLRRRRLGVDAAGPRRPPADVGDAGTGRRVVRARARRSASPPPSRSRTTRRGRASGSLPRRAAAGRRGSAGRSPGVAVGVVVAATVAIGGPGEWLDEFRGKGDVVQGSGRLGELSSNNRWTWWEESWELFRDAPAGGHGAHTFEIARRPIARGLGRHRGAAQRRAPGARRDWASSACCSASARPASRCSRARRRCGGSKGDERAAAAALAVLLPVYLLHALADIDWDFVAASAPVLLAVGVLLAAGRPPAEPRSRPRARRRGVRRRPRRPLLDHRAVARTAAGGGGVRGDRESRRRRAQRPRRARRAISTRCRSSRCGPGRSRRRPRGTRPERSRRYRDATELQPENSDTWFALGAYELGSAASATRTSTSTARTVSTRTGPRGCPAACSTRPARRWRAASSRRGRRRRGRP